MAANALGFQQQPAVAGALWAASAKVAGSGAAAVVAAPVRGFAASAGSGDEFSDYDRILYPAPRAFVGEDAPDFIAPGGLQTGCRASTN